MDDALLKLLRSVDTPTVCNAIETAQGKRGFDRYTRGTVLASAPEHRAMVGYARQRASRLARHPVMRRISSGSAGSVITDTCRRPASRDCRRRGCRCSNAVGAYWGEVNTTVHKALGLDGALTNGVMRTSAIFQTDFRSSPGLSVPVMPSCMWLISQPARACSISRSRRVIWFMPTGMAPW